jgi:hypothetical protein
MKERIPFAGKVRALLLDRSGKVVEETWTTNFLTELGEAYIADRLSDRNHADGAIDYMAIGTGTGQTRTSTILAVEEARVLIDGGGVPSQGTGADDNDVIWQATFPAGTPGTDKTITEGALFSLVSAGVMVNYFEIQPPRFKPTTLALIVQIYWTVGAS